MFVSNNTSSNSIELPAAIEQLITGSEYWQNAKRNRYKKLIRDGFGRQLMQLVELAANKRSAANWFATAASKAQWERTLQFLTKLSNVAEIASKVAQKLGTEVSRFIYKQVWSGVNVERWADTAHEVGKNKTKYFAWLCGQELAGAK